MEMSSLIENENKAKEVLFAFKVARSLDDLLKDATSEEGLKTFFPLKKEDRPCRGLDRLKMFSGDVNLYSLCRQFKVSMHINTTSNNCS